MGKIWSGGLSDEGGRDLSSLMTRDDNLIDSLLVKYEILGLVAYHLEIADSGLLPREETCEIMSALLKLYSEKVEMNMSHEDVHSLIDSRVKEETRAGGDLRVFLSRNDQIHFDIRSFYLDNLLEMSQKLLEITKEVKRHLLGTDGYMAGYTHYRQAMPVSFVTYFDYVAGIFADLAEEALALFNRFSDFSPLGYGSGYGSSLPINQKSLGIRLGFGDTYSNPMLGSFYRGVDDADVAFLEVKVMTAVSRLSQDLIMFSSDEYGFVKIPQDFTTGSSLMPNKRNPDFLEMLQGYASESLGILTTAASVLLNKGSGYHREFQITKDRVIGQTLRVLEVLDALRDLLAGLTVDSSKSEGLVRNSTHATMEAYSLFSKGLKWKDAYQEIGTRLREGGSLNEHRPVPMLSNYDSRIKETDEKVKQFKAKRAETVNMILTAAKSAIGTSIFEGKK